MVIHEQVEYSVPRANSAASASDSRPAKIMKHVSVGLSGRVKRLVAAMHHKGTIDCRLKVVIAAT